MSSKQLVASTFVLAATVASGAHGSAFTGRTATESAVSAGQSHAQPRDPRPGVARPASSRERQLVAAMTADPGNVANWLEVAKLQEARDAAADAESSYKSALAATGGAREVRVALAEFFFRIGQLDKSVAELERAAADNPGDPEGYQRVASYYFDLARKDPVLPPAKKLAYVDAGIAAADRALALKADYVEALTYKNILLRLKATLETDAARRDGLIAEADTLRNRAMDLMKARGGAGAGVGTAGPPPPPPPEFDQVDGQAPLRVGGNIKVPTKITDVRPVYPRDALDAGVSGLVILEVLIDGQGTVRSTRVLRSIPMLDQAAAEAVKGWRFTPTLLNGAPVPVLMTVTVNFSAQ
jgi:protein TonB